jgi:hypothetical protein
MTQTLSTLLLLAALLATYAPAQAAARNACYVAVRARGQYVVQTAGTAGTIDVYVDGSYVTTVSRLNQLWYATASKTAVVRGYDQSGLVC